MQYKFLFTESDGLAESEFQCLKDDLLWTCKEPFKITLDCAREVTTMPSVDALWALEFGGADEYLSKETIENIHKGWDIHFQDLSEEEQWLFENVADIDRVYEWQMSIEVSSKDVKAIEMLDEMQGEEWGGYGIEDFKEPSSWQNWSVYQSESFVN